MSSKLTPLGSTGYRQPARLRDNASALKPTGIVSIDGVAVAHLDRVLFTALAGAELDDNNKVWQPVVSAVTGQVTKWQLALDGRIPEGEAEEGDTIFISEGTTFGDTRLQFEGGAWPIVDAIGANRALSNLTGVAINASLIANGNRTLDLGSAALAWRDIYAGGTFFVKNTPNTEYAIISDDVTGANTSAHIAIVTGDSAALHTGEVRLRTGDAGGGNSGNISLITGAASGVRGQLVFQDGSEGTAGHVWTSTGPNGEGAWAPAAGGGANVTLSNLTAPTQINEALTFLQDFNGVITTSSTGGDFNPGPSLSISTNDEGGAFSHTGAITIASGLMGGAGNSGNININTGAANTGAGGGPYFSGTINIVTGTAVGTAHTGVLNLGTGAQNGASTAPSGALNIFTGISASGESGIISIATGAAILNSGGVSIKSGDSDAQSGDVLISSGQSTNALNNSGSIIINTGEHTSAGSSGIIQLYTGDSTNGESGSISLYVGNGVTSTGSIIIGDVGVQATQQGGSINIQSMSSGVGFNGGNINLETGTGDARGRITLADGTEGTLGHYWVETGPGGAGSWSELAARPMDTANRNALTPVGGWIIFNTDTSKLQVYDGVAWVDLH